MEDITVRQLKEKLDSGENIKLLDVREPYENQEFNIGGKLLPLGAITGAPEELADWIDEEIVVYCRSGNRSGMAKQLLEQMGFKKVRNLLGGMIDWQDQIKS